ncbi:hypothetical protein RSSM_00126 [Rhodopirellula sallentina SM41]|uniref:Uncharacterized protein n=1 Tax=Rhodopirellula sallentina SM41 TaxID=1263870 RepID=M5UKR5_9BACT|nr:hypothetical protein RSSM_00126 [Rhodopirellula sallentina SM41]
MIAIGVHGVISVHGVFGVSGVIDQSRIAPQNPRLVVLVPMLPVSPDFGGLSFGEFRYVVRTRPISKCTVARRFTVVFNVE